MSLIVDLSDHNTPVASYPALRDRCDGFYIKTTESDYFTASSWPTHYNGLAGKPRAPYHFMGQRGNWASQVAKFVTQMNKARWDWGPVLDVEFNSQVQAGSPTSADIRAWVAEFRRQTGLRFLYVYVGKSDLVGGCKPQDWIDGDMRIIAARYYADNYGAAFANLGLDHPLLDGCQYWDAGNITGLSKPCDVNNFRAPLISSWNYGPKPTANNQQFLLLNG